jgi:AcrR family transcriptional regulator
MISPGLRERKKQKTRWAIQEHALRLFAQQGYDATTVEQIAAAAEISPSTFFRYFPTKEDLVIEDEYDPILLALITAQPAGTHPIEAMRVAIRTAMGDIPPDVREKIMFRTTLQASVPALRARMLDNYLQTVRLIADAFAARLGRSADDPQVLTLAGACVGALLPVIFTWVDTQGERDLAQQLDQALADLQAGFPDLIPTNER